MRKIRFLALLAEFVLALLCSASGSSDDPVARSHWVGSPIQLDGLAEEWRPDLLLQEKKLDLEYGFRNNSRNLYILLVFRDPKSLSSIDTLGITIFCGPEGSKLKGNGVRFVRRVLTADQFVAMLENQGVRLSEEEKVELRARPRHSVFAAYAVDKKGKIIPPAAPVTGIELPAFRASRQERVSTYEFRIPLVSPEAYPAGIEAGPGKTVSLSFQWGGSGDKSLSPRTSWSTPWSLVSGGATADNGETRAQEFLNSYDSMSRPSLDSKKHAFRVQVRLANQPTSPAY